MFSRTVREKRNGSCSTMPICCRKKLAGVVLEFHSIERRVHQCSRRIEATGSQAWSCPRLSHPRERFAVLAQFGSLYSSVPRHGPVRVQMSESSVKLMAIGSLPCAAPLLYPAPLSLCGTSMRGAALLAPLRRQSLRCQTRSPRAPAQEVRILLLS